MGVLPDVTSLVIINNNTILWQGHDLSFLRLDSFTMYKWEDSLWYTGCPNIHVNTVTNSISSFQIILWFSIVIPTEKAVICKSFVCYVHNLFVYVLSAYGCTVVAEASVTIFFLNCPDRIALLFMFMYYMCKELGTLEWWISGLMLKPLFLLIIYLLIH